MTTGFAVTSSAQQYLGDHIRVTPNAVANDWIPARVAWQPPPDEQHAESSTVRKPELRTAAD
ncbi:MAG: hypothetical protein IPL70_14460 [Uliginosibacterium sp.]|nr:hypothetical protein [Uliginosibacterium sp.]